MKEGTVFGSWKFGVGEKQLEWKNSGSGRKGFYSFSGVMLWLLINVLPVLREEGSRVWIGCTSDSWKTRGGGGVVTWGVVQHSWWCSCCDIAKLFKIFIKVCHVSLQHIRHDGERLCFEEDLLYPLIPWINFPMLSKIYIRDPFLKISRELIVGSGVLWDLWTGRNVCKSIR